MQWKLTGIKQQGDGTLSLTYSTPDGDKTLRARTVALTVPAYVAADLLEQQVCCVVCPQQSLPAANWYHPGCLPSVLLQYPGPVSQMPLPAPADAMRRQCKGRVSSSRSVAVPRNRRFALLTVSALRLRQAKGAAESLRKFDYPPVGAVSISYPLSAIREDRKDSTGQLPGAPQLQPREQM